MSKTPFYKKGLGTYQGQTPDGALLYADSPLHHQTSKEHPHQPGKENQPHISKLVGPEEEKVDPRAGQDSRFQYNEAGDKPIHILTNGGTSNYTPGQLLGKDAQENTGMFDPTHFSNKPWGGYMTMGGKKISNEEFGNLKYEDLQTQTFNVRLPGKIDSKNNMKRAETGSLRKYDASNRITPKEFSEIQNLYLDHKNRRESNERMKTETLDYIAAGGTLKPTPAGPRWNRHKWNAPSGWTPPPGMTHYTSEVTKT